MNLFQRWFRSLNLRLALILFLALGGSYALMVWLLQTRVADLRISHAAEVLAGRVRDAEARLAARPEDAAATGPGQRIVEAEDPPGFQRGSWRHGPPAPEGDAPPPMRRQTPDDPPGPSAPPPGDADARGRFGHLHPRVFPLAQLDLALNRELGRVVELRPGGVRGEGPGLWIRLAGNTPRWLWVPASSLPMLAPLGRFELVPLIPVLGFIVAFVAALFLVVQVNRPLRRLGDALGEVGSASAPQPLALSGANEIRLLAGRFNDMLARLGRLESDRTTMLAGIAHDLRTPLTRLQLQIELAAGAQGIDAPRKAAMLRELDQLGEIIDQFRLFAGGAAGEPMEMRELALLLEEVAEPWRAQGLQLALQDGVYARVRPAALRRALGNLLGNAFAYGAPPVVLQLVAEADHVCIEVRDQGPGIAADRLDEARRPFARLDPARGGSGHSGLGLAIVERLIGDMGGQLELLSPPQGGLCARLRLPRAAPNAD
ncbi:hypothetical protein GCM10025771_04400 [Niveibacterium umoris]|uniref:histidine kinase n=1 Tax=Niveibacterium umoris TaxID=1193620 RepID=A0A840BN72_9RHOO|nr:ATP-binding protein [Niveibacterium umoris]MBB4014014.1 two-component system osmolarity sensor histidine kinase EnvZ [Niveibacterium umoris]